MIRKTLSLILSGSILITTVFSAMGCSAQKQSAGVVYENVDEKNSLGQSLYDSGEYEEALRQYAEAIRVNPIDTQSYLGAARCQMALENYSMAAMNLSSAARIDPSIEEIYNLYVELSNKSESISYARTAVSLAKRNNVESFLERVPAAPVLSVQSGSYNSRLEVEATADSGAEIQVEERGSNGYYSYAYGDTPVLITSGETELAVFAVVDGIPSEEVKARYVCNYEPTEVSFVDQAVEQMVRASLDIPDGPITDIDCEKIESLSSFSIPDAYDDKGELKYSLKSFGDLPKFPNLRSIDIEDILKTDDFSELTGCRRLNSIDLEDCGIKKLDFVKNIPNLQYLSLRRNPVSDLSPLSACKGLKYLNLAETSVKDLSPVKDLQLTGLSIDADKVKDLSVLLQWKETLRSLTVVNCGGEDLSSLGQMDGLEQLDLIAGNDYGSGEAKTISDLTYLASLTKLQYLDIYGLKSIKVLEPVKGLSQLQSLYFSLRGGEEPSDAELEDLQKSLPNCQIR